MRSYFKLASILLILFLFSLTTNQLRATENVGTTLSAKEIIKKMEDQMRGDTSYAVYTMTITNPRWTRTLKMKNWSEGEEKAFILIEHPPKEKGITYLKIKNEMWNYLPSVERTIKIPPSMLMQSWMGSDFTNDDLVKQSSATDDYNQKLLSIENYAGRKAYVIELTARPEAAVAWEMIKAWVDTQYFMPLRQEYFDEKKALVNIMYFENHQLISERWFPTRWRMVPQNKTGHETRIDLTEVAFDIQLPADQFTQGALRRYSR